MYTCDSDCSAARLNILFILLSLDKSEDYYLLSDALPEDKELRMYLQQVRLVSILADSIFNKETGRLIAHHSSRIPDSLSCGHVALLHTPG